MHSYKEQHMANKIIWENNHVCILWKGTTATECVRIMVNIGLGEGYLRCTRTVVRGLIKLLGHLKMFDLIGNKYIYIYISTGYNPLWF